MELIFAAALIALVARAWWLYRFPVAGGRDTEIPLYIFSGRLRSLLELNPNVPRALETILKDREHRWPYSISPLKRVLGEILEQVKKGAPLHEAMRKFPIFPRFYVDILKVGEESGCLPEAILKVEEYFLLKRKIKGFFIQPLITLVMLVFITAFMVTYILPTFVSLFEGMSMPLPLSTQVLIFVVRTLKDPLTQLGIIALAILLYFLFNSAPARRLLDAAKFNSPVFSRYVKMYEWVIFCKLMSLLLRDGQDCSRAVSSAAEGAVNEVFRQRLAPAYAFSGDLSADLKKTGLFDDAFLWMVSMGGKTDDLSRTFATMGEYYQEEVLGKWSRLLKILRVVYTLMVGMLAGFCIFAMLIPLFSIVFHITSSIQYRW